LIGEGFFQVVKSNGRPFIVHAGGVNIRVLGTSFNVKCYPKDENVETTLLHGAVSVSHPADPEKRSILLKPNEKLSIRKEFIPGDNKIFHQDPYVIEPIDTTLQPSRLPETAWVYNRLEFRGDDFSTLAEKMERWYNVKILFREDKVKRLRFIGSFENETIDQALLALQAVSRFNYKIKGNEIFIGASD
jgi:transmembrane sensor